jgi:hypothetical protein
MYFPGIHVLPSISSSYHFRVQLPSDSPLPRCANVKKQDDWTEVCQVPRGMSPTLVAVVSTVIGGGDLQLFADWGMQHIIH